MEAQFKSLIEERYQFDGENFILGTAMLNNAAIPNTQIRVPLTTLNRHGLISGATGTGKTKTLQNFVERLSEAGISTLLMDIKGDLSGLAKAGSDHPKITERHELIGTPWESKGFPIELLTISEEKGTRLRATVSEFGPVLFSKILELNDNQAGVVSLIFKYCDDKGLALLDLKDFKKSLQYLLNEGKDEIKAEYGALSPASTNVILRKLIELEEQGGERFFGERSFEVDDLLRKDASGHAFCNILRLVDIQDKPKLFSTFMLCLLAEIYQELPEIGDKGKPELVIFIDEAHLIFKEASKELLDQIENIIKLIRSKGVGIFFITQNPTDIPEAILGQLGLKVQHALRAFTAKDRKAIKLIAENFPITEYYNTSDLITELGIGEALVTVLNEKGIPTPLVHTLLRAPSSRMEILSSAEIDEIVSNSQLVGKYNEVIDRESAYEILSAKLEAAAKEAEAAGETGTSKPAAGKEEPSTFDKLSKNPLVKTLAKEVTRGILGVLGLGGRSRRRRY